MSYLNEYTIGKEELAEYLVECILEEADYV